MLSATSLQKIDLAVAKYPPGQKKSTVMAALVIAQDEHGWLSNEVMEYVANYLQMPPIAVREVATFYTMYNLAPTGKFKITICTNLPCALSGANEAADRIKRRLGIDFNGTTADGRVTLKEGECFGACGDAPVCLVNNKKMMSFMSNERIDAMLAELK
jgi:NADH-quinone oxidoreductase subunit E